MSRTLATSIPRGASGVDRPAPISSESVRACWKEPTPIRPSLFLLLDSLFQYLRAAPFARSSRRCESPFRQVEMPYSPQFRCNVSPLDATLASPLVCVANKRLTARVNHLDATLTKNRGEAVRYLPLSLESVCPSHRQRHAHDSPRRLEWHGHHKHHTKRRYWAADRAIRQIHAALRLHLQQPILDDPRNRLDPPYSHFQLHSRF